MKIAIGKIFTREEIEGVERTINMELSEKNKALLMEGDTSELLDYKGIKAKLHLRRNEEGDVMVHINNKKDTLEIPHKIEGHELSALQKKQLLKGETALLKTAKGNLYLKIDNELNRVIIKGERTMNIPKEIQGYKLSDGDKQLLANGQPMPPKVFKSDHGYILASFSMTSDRKGVIFTNSIAISNKEANEMIEKYNQPTPIKELISENSPNMAIDKDLEREITQPDNEMVIKSDDSAKENKVDLVVKRNLDEEFLDAFSKRDWEKLNRMASEDSYQPSKSALESADKLHNLTDHDKAALKTIFPEKAKEPELNILKNEGKTNVVLKNEKEQGKTQNTQRVGNIVEQAFRDM